MQYQVQLDPAKIYKLPRSRAAGAGGAGGEQCECGRRILFAGFHSFFYVRGLGLVTKTETSVTSSSEQQRRARANSRRRRGDDWKRAAAGRIRIPEK